MKVPARGLAHIRTHRQKAQAQMANHQIYLTLGGLELERQRLQRERAQALARIAAIDARCLDIDAQKAELTARLPAEPSAAAKPAPKVEKTALGLTLRY
jgi:hypothetical protein